jgi:hypothetical protein
VKLLDWIKSAVGLATSPAHPRQDRPPPNTTHGIDDRTAAEVASPDAGEIRPARPIEIEPARPRGPEPERPVEIEPATRISVEPENPISVEREKPISAEPAGRSFVASEGQVRVEAEGPPSPEEIDRRRAVVRAFFNDYWSSVEDKPASFAERLDGAEAYINERVAAGGEAWRLDPATRKLLGLPPSKKP